MNFLAGIEVGLQGAKAMAGWDWTEWLSYGDPVAGNQIAPIVIQLRTSPDYNFIGQDPPEISPVFIAASNAWMILFRYRKYHFP